MDNISPDDLMKSLNVELNRNRVFKAGEGAGASGSFFFFSKDNRFIIKTMQAPEKDKFLAMLDKYIEHIKRTKNKSLIGRIYGIYTIDTNYYVPMHLMIM